MRPGQTRRGTVLVGTGCEVWCLDEHQAFVQGASTQLEAVRALEQLLRRDLAAVEGHRKKLEAAAELGCGDSPTQDDLTVFDLAQRVVDGHPVSMAAHREIAQALLTKAGK